jgi:hypothetical protein
MKAIGTILITLVLCALDSLIVWQIHDTLISSLYVWEKATLILMFSIILLLTIYLVFLMFIDDEK